MRRLPIVARAYVASVWVVAAAVVLPVVWISADWQALVVLASAYFAAGYVATYRIRQTVSVSAGFPIALAAVLLLSPSAAGVVAAMHAFANHLSSDWVKRAFNGSMSACSAAAAALVYGLAGGDHVWVSGTFPYLVQAVLAALTYCAVNGLLLAGVLKATQGTPIVSVWRSSLSRTILPYLGYGLFGVIIAVLWQSEGGKITALLVLLPLYIARWTFAQYAEEQEAYNATVSALVQAVETKDHYTRGHSERVGRGATMIARELGMADDRREALYFAGILHDVGKLGVPTRVLQKDGPLTEDEYAAMKFHPMHGLEMVRGIGFLREAYDGILHHHERIDGRGYPLGLEGDKIPEFARVIAVADAFDSMTSTRSYRGARTVEDAIAELRRCAGAQFDPRMVEAMASAVADEGWEVQALTPPPAEVAATASHYDHDDPTVQIPVIPAEPTPRGERR